ncbi:MAG: glycosyltransferase family 2 protein, partial [Gemmatimonadota bacterium]
MSAPDVTVVMVPHERFSAAPRALDALLEHTPPAVPILYVDVRSPRAVRRRVAARAKDGRVRVLPSDRFLAPNAARNLALPHVTTRYVVFVANDVLVHPNWLDPLVQCAEATGAWLVAPLYLMGEGARQVIHMAGGVLHIRQEGGERTLFEKDYHPGVRLADLPAPLERREVEMVEFHCLLVRMETFARLGALDEALQNVREHEDLCLAVRQAGGTIWLEPR